jgi:hypothetical protein
MDHHRPVGRADVSSTIGQKLFLSKSFDSRYAHIKLKPIIFHTVFKQNVQFLAFSSPSALDSDTGSIQIESIARLVKEILDYGNATRPTSDAAAYLGGEVWARDNWLMSNHGPI